MQSFQIFQPPPMSWLIALSNTGADTRNGNALEHAKTAHIRDRCGANDRQQSLALAVKHKAK